MDYQLCTQVVEVSSHVRSSQAQMGLQCEERIIPRRCFEFLKLKLSVIEEDVEGERAALLDCHPTASKMEIELTQNNESNFRAIK